ncbi:MAG: hypothetical protein ABI868_24155 [Acidobacteriota bacterium]
MTMRLRAIGLSLVLVAVALPAAAQDPRRIEVGASLVNLMILIPEEGARSTLFGIPSASLGLLSPGAYAAFFATPRLAIEPQASVLLVSTGGDATHVVNVAGQVDYFLNGSAVSSPYLFGAVGLVMVSDSDTTPKQVSGGAGYRIRMGDRLVLRVDGRFTHLTDGQGNGLGFNLSIGGLFGR